MAKINRPDYKDVASDVRYLKLLARDFPTISKVTTEIINLEAILHLPKSTEHFLADLHGENEAFQHVLRNASGNIKRKVNELFGNTLRELMTGVLSTPVKHPDKAVAKARHMAVSGSARRLMRLGLADRFRIILRIRACALCFGI